MKKTLLVSFVLATTPLGIAQDTAEAPAMPSPKVEEHEALKSLAGTWDSTVRMAAMPGVPGMEEATEVEGTERAELICDGLWLKWTVEGEFAGQPFQGLWLAGYDPFAERYVGFWIDSNEPTPMEMTGEYDASSKKWTWSGECSQGAMRSEITWKDADTMVETSWLTPPGGEEVQTMVATRKRVKGDVRVAAAATAKNGDAPTPQDEGLHRAIGQWDATMKMAMDPSQPAMEVKGAESVRPICNGNYTWSDFTASMMGMPFEGHAIVGWDEANECYVSYWIDSMMPIWMKSTGKQLENAAGVEMRGKGTDGEGNEMTTREVVTWKGDDERHLKMEFTTEQGTQTMEIVYVRKQD